MRTYQHIIDTKSIKKILRAFPDHWVVRELSERDYGTDLTIEIFYESGKDKHNHTIYESSGCVCNIQVKGTNEQLNICASDNSIHYSFDKKSLLYVERFAIPFLLVRVDVSDTEAETYYVWLQRYIKDVLDIERPNWREEDQKSFTIKIPIENSLTNRQTKIERIASRIKYIEELIEYREIYASIDPMLSAISAGQHSSDQETYQYLKSQVSKVTRLITLLSRNNCCIDINCTQELYNFVVEVENGSRNKDELSNYPHKFNFELLSYEVGSIASIENFVAENEGKKVY